MKPQLAVVHESEAQRQQVRLSLPAQIEISSARLDVVDWSNGGLAIKWSESSAKSIQSGITEDKTLKGTLLFPFDGFELSLPVEMEVRYVNADQQRIGCRFSNLTKRHISVLQFLVSSYISGEVVNVGDIIDVVGRNNFTRERKIPNPNQGLSPWESFKRRVGKTTASLIVAFISILVFGYLVMSMYERIFVVTAKAAEVAADVITVTAPTRGIVFYKKQKDQLVKKGSPLMMVTTVTGDAVSVDSPCDCIVKETLLAEQERASKGQPVMKLVDQEAQTYINAYVPNSDVIRFSGKQSAMVRLPGYDGYIQGEVTNLRTTSDSSAVTVVTIKPETKLPTTWVDDPALVKFNTLHFFSSNPKPTN
ncbi:MAG: HlyD family efflux transporter periplasmic adaptor subunit [Rickettsiales bacterium]